MGLFSWFCNEKEIEEEICEERKKDFSNFIKITEFIYEKSGITELDKRALTSSRLQNYAISKDVYTTDEFLVQMKNDNQFYQEIINIATVNETFFLREIKELDWLVNYIKDENRPLKILSMPSSSGEEIYSILLMLNDKGIDTNKLDITGYDINSQAVSNAIDGKYDEHSLHKIVPTLRTKYFSTTDDSIYMIKSKFKNQAQFMQKNIFDLVDIKENFDVILSRNMFIYFDDKKRKLALDIIVDLLKKDGIYIKGHADHIYKHPQLENICYGVYRKIN